MKKRLTCAGGLTLALLAASAGAQAGSDLQSKLDEAKRQSCGICKKQINEHPVECAVEVAAIAKIDCANVKSYKTDDAKKLNEECIAKWKAPTYRAPTPMPKSSPPAPKPSPQASEEPKGNYDCRAVDGDEVLAQMAADDLFDCYNALQKKIRALKCAAGVHDFKFKSQSMRNKPGWNPEWSVGAPMTVFCEK
jgi:hypothetical protein